ncbi:MAG: DUF1254 domain-containing protein [Phenylobacterium sp.]|uniref:DUF1254 domain-containing protein n=1 Tax=Phenylobacterium sp. TaxID=1871053 RepID=UPI0027195057|nr:DUF1254 domain-containing protein [Phenylobacterium sp.]MDO8902136.1 DUF1254 domain-containing protein [Phenylobacterium sp.]
MSGTDLKTAAMKAWLYGLPLIEIAATRARGLSFGQSLNTIAHVRNLATPKHRAVTTPNNDTLYSSAQLDLSQGPVTLSLPATGDRYFSLALMDAYTNNFAILGTRTTGPNGGTFTLVGPHEAAEGAHVLRAPTPHVWALGRVVVYGPGDLEAARQVQSGLTIQGPAAPTPAPAVKRSAPWQDYFAALSELMKANPPPVTDRALLEEIASLGLEVGFDAGRFTAAEAAEIEAGLAEARVAVRRGGLTGDHFIDGWSYPSATLGDFGQNYHYRAAVALGGLAALPPVEALYMRARGDQPRALYDGTKAYSLHFPADRLPPVHSFWSLSLYEATEDGQFYFADNPLDRYAIGDRTEGLTYNADGSLDIWIGSQSPGEDRKTNWLPAPAGPFALFMRTYLPKPELLDGAYRLPPVEAVEGTAG